MGKGSEIEEDLIVRRLSIAKDWIQTSFRNVTSPDHLAFIHAIGDSMSPTINSGDILLVDTGIKSANTDGVYVLSAHGRLFIKRVQQKMDGTFEITSDNPSVKTISTLNGEHEVDILGRAVWVWNGKRL